MAQLEDKVSVRFVIFGWNDCEFWLMIGLLDPRLGGLWASLTWVHCVHSVLRGNTWLPQFPSSPTTVIIREVLECGFLSKIYFLGYEPHTQWFLQNLGQALVGCATGFLTRIHSRFNSLEIIKSNLYTVTPFLEFPFQVIQMQTETQQNLQKEMQKMHQKFKAREDKSKKEHREEMGQVIQDWAWLPSFAFDMGFLCCISN